MTPPPKRTGLGRGLASLIPTGPSEGASMGAAAADVMYGGAPSATVEKIDDVGALYREIDPALIEPNPKQPRQVFDGDALAELVHSIREFGLMQPIVVRAVEAVGGKPRYQLVMGERRWRAAQEAGLEAIPAIVRETADESMLRDALLENIHRAQLNPLEEAAAYQQLLDEFGVTHEELAVRIGRSRPVISNMIRLMRLPIAVQRRGGGRRSCPPGTRVLCWRWRAVPTSKRNWPPGSSRRACRSERRRRPSRWPTMTEFVTPDRARAARRFRCQGCRTLPEKLSSAFDTRVTVSLGKRKGKIVVEFGSVDDLQRIVDLMNAARA